MRDKKKKIKKKENETNRTKDFFPEYAHKYTPCAHVLKIHAITYRIHIHTYITHKIRREIKKEQGKIDE